MARSIARVSFVAVLTALLATLIAARPAAAKPLEQAPVLANHVVQPGEWLYCIARGYGVSPNAIYYANGLVNPNLLSPGMVLVIPNVPATLPPGPWCPPQGQLPPPPPPPPPCNCTTYHYVQPGQNLYRIGLMYGVSMWRIAQCNGIANPNYIRAYSYLCIPSQ